MQESELDKRFDFHPATEITGPQHDNMREACKFLANEIVNTTPECREQSLAITHLEEAMMWANAAIARHP